MIDIDGEKVLTGLNDLKKRLGCWMNVYELDTIACSIAFIEGKMPKVLSLEEAMEAKDPVYFESEGNACFWVGVDYGADICGADKTILRVYRLYAETMFLPAKTYGKTWRCWSAKPTEEKRKAVKWDE